MSQGFSYPWYHRDDVIESQPMTEEEKDNNRVNEIHSIKNDILKFNNDLEKIKEAIDLVIYFIDDEEIAMTAVKELKVVYYDTMNEVKLKEEYLERLNKDHEEYLKTLTGKQ